jgi:ankyrin repeat protein
MLVRNNANVSEKDNDGNTRLFYVCLKTNIDVVHMLIDNKAEVNVKNDAVQTPFSMPVLLAILRLCSS